MCKKWWLQRHPGKMGGKCGIGRGGRYQRERKEQGRYCEGHPGPGKCVSYKAPSSNNRPPLDISVLQRRTLSHMSHWSSNQPGHINSITLLLPQVHDNSLLQQQLGLYSVLGDKKNIYISCKFQAPPNTLLTSTPPISSSHMIKSNQITHFTLSSSTWWYDAASKSQICTTWPGTKSDTPKICCFGLIMPAGLCVRPGRCCVLFSGWTYWGCPIDIAMWQVIDKTCRHYQVIRWLVLGCYVWMCRE